MSANNTTSSEKKSVNSKNIYIRVLDGASANKTLAAQYNPQEISFTKTVGWSKGNEGAGTDCPALMFTAGEAISMSLELLFDYYEQQLDVRGIVKDFMSLCMIDKTLKRPPAVQVCWIDSNVLGIGKNFVGVIESASAKYTMFTSMGVPVRATVSVTIKEAEEIGYSEGTGGSSGGEGAASGGMAGKTTHTGVTETYANGPQVANTPGAAEYAVDSGKDPSKPENYPL